MGDYKERRKRELLGIKDDIEESKYLNKIIGEAVAKAYWTMWDAIIHKSNLDVEFEITAEIKIGESVVRMSTKDKDALNEKRWKEEHEYDVRQAELEKLSK